MRLPIQSTFLISLLGFIACGYLGYFVALKLAYRHNESTFFAALGAQDAPQFRRLTRTMFEIQASRLLTQSSLQSPDVELSNLGSLHAKLPTDFWPIVDLRMATDHALAARLAQHANIPSDVNKHTLAAQTLLRSLGWKDVSQGVLDQIAENQLRPRERKR